MIRPSEFIEIKNKILAWDFDRAFMVRLNYERNTKNKGERVESKNIMNPEIREFYKELEREGIK